MTLHSFRSKGASKARNILAGVLMASTSLIGASAAWAETTITAVMHSGLRVLDPVITTAHITRNHAYMIYDVLVAVDSNFTPQPQMADWTVSEDGKVYTFTLRDGLKFHDGAPVTAADAEASLKRWAQKDSGGQIIMDRTESLTATDDKTLVWTLTEPFAPLLDTIGKQSALPPFIMPARVAATPADTAITEHVGSGPFKFVEAEFQPGVSVTYIKNEDYVPRSEPADNMAGGKVVNVDKVVWATMPDASTSINALLGNEIDYIESVQVDLLPLLEGDPDVIFEKREPLGYQTIGRMNFKHPPFDNVKVRQAAMMALDQEAVLAALIGNPEYYSTCGAIFGCGTPLADTAGSDSLTSGGDLEAAKALLAEAGYENGLEIEIQVTNNPVQMQMMQVVQAMASEAGIDIKLVAKEFATLLKDQSAGDFTASQIGWSGRVDPDGNIHQFMTTDAGLNDSKYSNAEVDTLLNTARTSNDQDVRKESYNAARAILNDEAPIVYLYHETWIWALDSAISGFTPYPDGMIRLKGMKKEEG